MVPLIIDALGRLVMLCFIAFGEDNKPLFRKILDDKLETVLFTADILSVIPFFIRLFYYHPSMQHEDGAPLVFLTIIELLITGRILRLIKDIPSVRAIRIALSRSASHLVLPLFFFFVFNITAGVLFYFIEPCFNVNSCFWLDLFSATFYSIVTMTTTGYGNQYPLYEVGRFIACCVMVFGSLFLSMPLAIIGNEYDKAWNQVKEDLQLKEERRMKEDLERKERQDANDRFRTDTMRTRSLPANTLLADTASTAAVTTTTSSAAAASQKKASQRELSVAAHPTMQALHHMRALVHTALVEGRLCSRITPRLLLLLCEVRAWLPSFYLTLKQTFDMVYGDPLPDHFPWAIKSLGLGHSGDTEKENGQLGTEVAPTAVVAAAGGGRRRMSLFSKPAASSTAHHPNPNSSDIAGMEMVERRHSNSNHTSHGHNNPHPTHRNSHDHHSSKDLTHTPHTLHRHSSSTPSASLLATTDKKNYNDDDEQYPEPSVPIVERVKGAIQSMPQSLRNMALNAMSRRTVADDFMERLEQAYANPNSFRNRMWILLELPQSSSEARMLQFLLVVLVVVSIFSLFTQTILKLTPYGESTDICGLLLSQYCSDKTDPLLDPGCFTQAPPPLGGVLYPLQHLTFDSNQCDAHTCFGKAWNFGAQYTNATCLNEDTPPFPTTPQLWYRYGPPNIFTSRQKMHQINGVCNRIECNSSVGSDDYNANRYWIILEFVINSIFTVELLLRVFVTNSLIAYIRDAMNVFDVLAVFPFYAEVFSSLLGGKGFQGLDFSILASSPGPIFLVTMRSFKVFRMFKLTRHFHASKVLSETARKVWRQILGMLALLSFLTVLFAILLYEVERGKRCYVGDKGCEPPASIADYVHTGDMILVDKKGNASSFANVFYGLWFCFVTLTTTGYGDVTPSTNVGQVMAIFLMISGTFYMSMPLTAAASTFYSVHTSYEEKVGRTAVAPQDDAEGDEQQQQAAAAKHAPRLKDVLRISSGRLLALQRDLSGLIDHLERPSAMVDDVNHEEDGDSSSEESNRDEDDDVDGVPEEKSSRQRYPNTGSQDSSSLPVATNKGRHKVHHSLASPLLKRLQGLHQQLDELLDGMRNDVEVLVQLCLDRSKMINNNT